MLTDASTLQQAQSRRVANDPVSQVSSILCPEWNNRVPVAEAVALYTNIPGFEFVDGPSHCCHGLDCESNAVRKD